MRWGLIVLLAACSGSKPETFDASSMMENLRTGSGEVLSSECVQDAVVSCIEPGAVCEGTYEDWVECVFDADCVDDDGFLDEVCAEVCTEAAIGFEDCIYEDCEAFDDCLTDDTGSDGDDRPEPTFCVDEESACYGDDACGPALANWNTCAEEQGCVAPDGTYDGTCAYQACGSDYGALNECVFVTCDTYLECLLEEQGPTGDPCADASSECFYGDCAPDYGRFMGCILSNGCIDADGFYDELCGQEACAEPIAALSTCTTQSCPDYVEYCH